jgi:hypothetical protein
MEWREEQQHNTRGTRDALTHKPLQILNLLDVGASIQGLPIAYIVLALL